MRKLTLKGYLKNYLIGLSESQTSSVSKLLKELPGNPRLKEPLVVYSILTGVSDRICMKDKDFFEEYVYAKTNYSNLRLLSTNYEKLLRSFDYASNKKRNDDDSKMRMRERILLIQREKNITNYRIYTDLKMNAGNVNSFLKHGQCDKLRIDSVRKIWKHVEAI